MLVNLGARIRLLRQKDSRTQEQLATALGITPQAISRWEAGSSYPDIEIIPAIANYFNISIDELFGYTHDRQQKLNDILKKADDYLNEQGDMTECLKMLRSAAEEFPSEPLVLTRLGYALSMQGWKCHGARSYTTEDSDYAHEDWEYNAANTYWQEEIRVFEKVLSMDIPSKDRDAITFMLIQVCAKMGYGDKAKALASKQNSVFCSRELLMPHATAAEERDKYYGEAIIILLTEFKRMIVSSVITKISLFSNQAGIELFIELARLYESVFSDGRCGASHSDICELYVMAAHYESRFGSVEKALGYFSKAFEHKKLYDEFCKTPGYHYTAPLVAKTDSDSDSLSTPSGTRPGMKWEDWVNIQDDKFKEIIRADERFKECFAV